MSARILIVDDEPEMAKLCADIVKDNGHTPVALTSPVAALPLIQEQPFDLLLTDVRMPEMNGVDLIGHVFRYDPRIAIIAMTAFGSIDTAVRAVRAGALDYLPKPFQPKDLSLRIDRALSHRAMALEIGRLRSEVAKSKQSSLVVGRSHVMEEIVQLVKRVADSYATVLIKGPIGGGKENIARALHAESQRRSGNFVSINCAALPEALLDIELFGRVAGYGDGATSDLRNVFEEASSGTLFLDDVSELSLPLQGKLVGVLHELEAQKSAQRRAGTLGAASENSRVRVVAATTRDLRAAVAERTFREDLFYRLAVIEITIPELRHRPDDIVPLAEHFLAKSLGRSGKSILGLSGAAKKILLAYDFPGNVRELENAIERAVTVCEGEHIFPDDLPEIMKTKKRTDLLYDAALRNFTMDELCRSYALLILEKTGGNKQRAAAILEVDRRTLQRWFAEESRGGARGAESAPSIEVEPKP